VTPEDISLGILPFYHCYGMVPVMMGVLQDGGKLVTIPKFDPEMFLKAIMTQKVCLTYVSNFMISTKKCSFYYH